MNFDLLCDSSDSIYDKRKMHSQFIMCDQLRSVHSSCPISFCSCCIYSFIPAKCVFVHGAHKQSPITQLSKALFGGQTSDKH